MKKNQSGITLIALVITIIVLLILAGVSIAMLTGENGILTKASGAKTESGIREVEEAIKLGLSEIQADKLDTVSTNKGTTGTVTAAEIFKAAQRNNPSITATDGKTNDSTSTVGPFTVYLTLNKQAYTATYTPAVKDETTGVVTKAASISVVQGTVEPEGSGS